MSCLVLNNCLSNDTFVLPKLHKICPVDINLPIYGLKTSIFSDGQEM